MDQIQSYKKILLMGGPGSVLDSARDVLSDHGHQIERSPIEEKCLEKNFEEYELVMIFMDYPERNYFDLIEKIIEKNYTYPILVILGSWDERNNIAIKPYPNMEFIMKTPNFNDNLPQIIETALAKNRILINTEIVLNQEKEMQEELMSANDELFHRQEQLIVLTDELDLKNRELERSNRMKDLFSDIVRHDLMNPIGIIKNLAEIDYAVERDEIKKQDLRVMLDTSKSMIEIIESASKFSRLEEKDNIEKKTLDLADIIKKAISMQHDSAKTNKMEIITLFDGEYPIMASPLVLDVFLNFISNGIKYAKSGRKLEIGIEDLGESYIAFVRDFGKGIPDNAKESIFQRFTRLDKGLIKGSGLGLSIVLKIVELHNGKIWVEDNPTGGAVFKLELPKTS